MPCVCACATRSLSGAPSPPASRLRPRGFAPAGLLAYSGGRLRPCGGLPPSGGSAPLPPRPPARLGALRLWLARALARAPPAPLRALPLGRVAPSRAPCGRWPLVSVVPPATRPALRGTALSACALAPLLPPRAPPRGVARCASPLAVRRV